MTKKQKVTMKNSLEERVVIQNKKKSHLSGKQVVKDHDDDNDGSSTHFYVFIKLAM
jgi:hypothetical protein